MVHQATNEQAYETNAEMLTPLQRTKCTEMNNK